jgi:hypothetical protein
MITPDLLRQLTFSGNSTSSQSDTLKPPSSGARGDRKSAHLQLVFVNSCHSQKVASVFLNAGIPHVIAVRQPGVSWSFANLFVIEWHRNRYIPTRWSSMHLRPCLPNIFISPSSLETQCEPRSKSPKVSYAPCRLKNGLRVVARTLIARLSLINCIAHRVNLIVAICTKRIVRGCSRALVIRITTQSNVVARATSYLFHTTSLANSSFLVVTAVRNAMKLCYSDRFQKANLWIIRPDANHQFLQCMDRYARG